MIYTDATKKAMKLCFEMHKEQTDKAGLPYVFHPFYVAEQMDDEDSTVTALLHDVVEDTDCTFEKLENMGFNETVITALKLLTHGKNTDYTDYIMRIKINPTARKVKLAYLKHNSDLTRLSAVTDEDRKRLEKYKRAVEILIEIN